MVWSCVQPLSSTEGPQKWINIVKKQNIHYMFYAFTSSICSKWLPLTSSIFYSNHLELLVANLSNGAGFLFHPARELAGSLLISGIGGIVGVLCSSLRGRTGFRVPCQRVGASVSRKFLWQSTGGGACGIHVFGVRLESAGCSQMARKRQGFQIPVSNRGGRGVWTN
jgi:hypothetical protein